MRPNAFASVGLCCLVGLLSSCAQAPCGTSAACRDAAESKIRENAALVDSDPYAASRRIADDFERACDLGDADACRTALSYWLRRRHDAGNPRARRDAYVHATSQEPDSPASAAECAPHLTRNYAKLTSLVFAQAEKAGTADAYEAMAMEFPGSPPAKLALARADELRAKAATERVVAAPDSSLTPLTSLWSAEGRRCVLVARALIAVPIDKRSVADLRAALSTFSACDVGNAEVAAARERLAKAEDEASYAATVANATISGLETYRRLHPNGAHVREAREREADLAYEAALKKEGAASVAALRAFLATYGDVPAHRREARLEEIKRAEAIALASEGLDTCFAFLETYDEADSAKVRAEAARRLRKSTDTFGPEPYDRFLARVSTGRDADAVRAAKGEVERRIAREKAANDARLAREEAERNRRDRDAAAAAAARRASGRGLWCVYQDRSRRCVCSPRTSGGTCWTDDLNVSLGMGSAALALTGPCSPCSDN
jgi:hypothetical protein